MQFIDEGRVRNHLACAEFAGVQPCTRPESAQPWLIHVPRHEIKATGAWVGRVRGSRRRRTGSRVRVRDLGSSREEEEEREGYGGRGHAEGEGEVGSPRGLDWA